MTGELLAIGAALWFSIGTLFVRMGNEHLDRSTGLVVCLAANAGVLLLASAIRLAVGGTVELHWAAIAAFAAAGLCSSFFARWASIGSIERLGPSRSAVVKNVQPIITAVLAVVILGETVSLGAGLAAGLIVAGTMLCSGERASEALAKARWGMRPEHRMAGVVLAIVSAFGYAVANIFRKSGIEVWDEPLIGATVGVLAATVGSLALRRGTGSAERPAGGNVKLGYFHFAMYGLLAAASQICIFYSLRITEVWVTNLFVCTEPALTAVLSWAVFRGREHFTRLTVASIAAVVVGSALMILT